MSAGRMKGSALAGLLGLRSPVVADVGSEGGAPAEAEANGLVGDDWLGLLFRGGNDPPVEEPAPGRPCGAYVCKGWGIADGVKSRRC